MLYSQIKADMVEAQKAKDVRLLGVIRLLLTEIGYAQVDKQSELNDEEIIKVLMKEQKKRRESIEVYEKAGAVERADQEKYELEEIQKYLPKMMDEEEVLSVIKAEAETSGVRGGRLMGLVMGKLRGKVDGSVVNRLVSKNFHG